MVREGIQNRVKVAVSRFSRQRTRTPDSGQTCAGQESGRFSRREEQAVGHAVAAHKMWTLLSCFILLLSLLTVGSSYAQSVDILLKGGHVIDHANGIDGPMDVAITDGKIAEVAESISADEARRVVDVQGLYVTPGFIDLHTHVFHGTEEVGFPGFEINNSFGSISPDAFTFRSGVTTVVDAGSSGWRDFYTFKKQTVENSRTRVLAFLSITGSGMLGTVHSQYLDDMDPEVTAFTINQNRDILVGVKKHHYQGPDFTPVERAVEAGELAGVPVMVDFGGHVPPLSLETLLLEKLRPGDILTHTHFASQARQGAVDENGRVKPFIFEAQERGVIFDVGHGAGGFQWEQAVPSVEQGFIPNTISTDLYRNSMNAGMKDLSNVMSKFLAMGLSVQDVVLRTTWNPAQVIQKTELGNLSVGSEADVTVFNVREGDFGFLDARNQRVGGDRKLETELTIRAGRVVWDLNGLAASDWSESSGNR